MAKAKENLMATTLPQGWIEAGGERVGAAGDALVEAVLEAWQIKQDIDAREEDYALWVQEIKLRLGRVGTVVVPGVCRAIYSEPQRVSITDVEALRALLGERFGDLVKLEEKVGCTDALLNMASDGDDPQGRLVRTLLKVSTGSSVRMLADAPAKKTKAAREAV